MRLKKKSNFSIDEIKKKFISYFEVEPFVDPDDYIDPHDRKKSDHLNLKKFFINEDYIRIFSEISEEPYWYREYGCLSSKKFGNYILFFDFAKYSKYDDGGDIEIIKSFNHDEKIDIVDLVINHYKKLEVSECDYIALNSVYDWDLDNFDKLLKKTLKDKNDYFHKSGVYYDFGPENYDKLHLSTDPAEYDTGRMHPDIIIYLIDDKEYLKPIRKLKPPDYNNPYKIDQILF